MHWWQLLQPSHLGSTGSSMTLGSSLAPGFCLLAPSIFSPWIPFPFLWGFILCCLSLYRQWRLLDLASVSQFCPVWIFDLYLGQFLLPLGQGL